MSYTITKTVDYHEEKAYTSLGKFSRRFTTNNQGNYTFDRTAASPEYRFNLADTNSYVNMSRSVLCGTLTIPADATPANNYLSVAQMSLIESIRVVNAAGQELLNITQDLPRYLRTVGLQNTSYEDFTHRDVCEATYPSNALASANVQEPYSGGSWLATTKNYTEPLYLRQSGSNAVLTWNFRFSLGAIKRTILAVDKTIYTGNDKIELIVTWAPYDRFAYTSAGATMNVVPTLTNVKLEVYTETNEHLKASILNKFNSEGLSLLHEVPKVFIDSGSTSTTKNVSAIVTRAMGSYLTTVHVTPFQTSKSLSSNFDCNNTAGAKIVSFQTSVDNKPLRDQTLTAASDDVWLEMKDKLRGTVIQDKAMFDRNWSFTDDFRGDCEHDEEKNLISGKFIGASPDSGDTAQLTYQLESTCSGSNNSIYITAILLRKAMFTKEGIIPQVSMPNVFA